MKQKKLKFVDYGWPNLNLRKKTEHGRWNTRFAQQTHTHTHSSLNKQKTKKKIKSSEFQVFKENKWE